LPGLLEADGSFEVEAGFEDGGVVGQRAEFAVEFGLLDGLGDFGGDEGAFGDELEDFEAGDRAGFGGFDGGAGGGEHVATGGEAGDEALGDGFLGDGHGGEQEVAFVAEVVGGRVGDFAGHFRAGDDVAVGGALLFFGGELGDARLQTGVAAEDVAEEGVVLAEAAFEVVPGQEEIRIGPLHLALSGTGGGPFGRFDQEAVVGDVETHLGGGVRDQRQHVLGGGRPSAAGIGDGGGGEVVGGDLDHDVGAGRQGAGSGQAEDVDVLEVVEVGAVVALRIGFAGADVVRVGDSEDLDETVSVVAFAGVDRGAEVFEGVGLAAEELGLVLGTGEDAGGVADQAEGAVVDLFEVGAAGVGLGGGDVEGHRVRVEAERVEAAVGAVDFALDLGEAADDFVEFGDGGAVDDLDADVIGVGVLVGEEGVGDGPIEEGGLADAAAPFGEAPGAVGAGVTEAGGVGGGGGGGGGVFVVELAMGEFDDLDAGAGAGRRRLRRICVRRSNRR
jgi:hypothetical protein